MVKGSEIRERGNSLEPPKQWLEPPLRLTLEMPIFTQSRQARAEEAQGASPGALPRGHFDHGASPSAPSAVELPRGHLALLWLRLPVTRRAQPAVVAANGHDRHSGANGDRRHSLVLFCAEGGGGWRRVAEGGGGWRRAETEHGTRVSRMHATSWVWAPETRSGNNGDVALAVAGKTERGENDTPGPSIANPFFTDPPQWGIHHWGANRRLAQFG
eukprot:scaffold139314_cov172-Phaeocystis_antarctica.AAC.3